MEQVLQGWLVKSPPEKKSFGTWKIFGRKWRRRYFVLYAPPQELEEFPTDTVSAMLEYYSDKKLHNRCGSIDLATCEEVYSALDSETYKHVFCIQTTHKCRSRTYYLAAETEAEMNKWVMTLCNVLGLAETDDQPALLPAVIEAKIQQILQPLTVPVPRPVTQPPLTVKPKLNFSTHPSAKQLSPELPNRPVTLAFQRNYGSESDLLESVSAADDGPSRSWARTGGMHAAGSVPDLLSPAAGGRHSDVPPPLPPERGVTSPVKTDSGEAQLGYYDTPGIGDAFYNTPPVRYPHPTDAGELYNVPPTAYPAEGDSSLAGDACYDVPPTGETDMKSGKKTKNKKSKATESEMTGGEVYNVPPTRSADNSHGEFSSGGKKPKKPGKALHMDQHATPDSISDQTYDIPSAEKGGGNKSQSAYMADETYDTPPPKEVKGRKHRPPQPMGKPPVASRPVTGISDETYDTPPSSESLGKAHHQKPNRDLPPSAAGQETYDTPPTTQHHGHKARPTTAPRSQQLVAETGNDEMYDVPPAKSTTAASQRVSLSGAADLTGTGLPGDSETYDVPGSRIPPVPAKRNQAAPPKPPRPTVALSTHGLISTTDGSGPAAQQSAKNTDNVSEDEDAEKDKVGDLPAAGPRGRFQQKGSFHSSNASAPPCVNKKEVHDSIRFTQRSKSFKRSIPSQQRSNLPLPVKRYVEPDESSSSSSDDSSSPVSQDRSHLTTDDSQLENSKESVPNEK